MKYFSFSPISCTLEEKPLSTELQHTVKISDLCSNSIAYKITRACSEGKQKKIPKAQFQPGFSTTPVFSN